MERLTERDEFGNSDIVGVDGMNLQCNLTFDELNRVTNALNKLAEYEDLEEQGKLLKNPQKLKDAILDEMKKFMDEYHGYCESGIEYLGDPLEAAMGIIQVAFSEEIAMEC